VTDVALVVEGQSGLTWERWKRLVLAAEELGFAALYRTDHLIAAQPPDEPSLELWTSLTWLACNTSRIEFGNLVSPLTFRHPVHLAHAAAALHELSGGRFTLGLGAGWARREHAMYGFEMFAPAERMERFEEGLHVVSQLFCANPATFEGRYFRLHDAVLAHSGRPPILVAGRSKRSLELAARYADQWNVMFVTPDEFHALGAALPPGIKRTVMVGAEVSDSRHQEHSWMWWRESSLVTARDHIKAYEQAGADRVILQWLDLEDLAGLERLASKVL
jgi:alkanesulfonate monooxygenase SsuD/methylene tetrahydromethanopterin reductase-like flavin-dependent oxidoreductase (luciferase family)